MGMDTIPSLYNAVNGGSTLNGWTPVNRINRGSRGTWLSGVPLSTSKMSTGFFDGGGSGMSGSPGLGMMSSTVIWPFLNDIVSDSVIVCVVMLAMMVQRRGSYAVLCYQIVGI